MTPYDLHLVYIARHDAVQPRRLTFGTLNVRSLNNKVDVVKQLRIDGGTDVLCLTETWHEDGDAVPIRRLRCEGLQIVERACSLPTNAKLDNIGFTNRSVVAIVAPNNIWIAVLPPVLSRQLSNISAPVLHHVVDHASCYSSIDPDRRQYHRSSSQN